MPPIVEKTLKELGLGDKERAILITLFEGGPMLAAAIARTAKINRTTTYGVLQNLSALGLVSSTKKEGATRYQSIAPEMLPAYIRRRRNLLADSEKMLAEAIPQIKLLRAKGKSLPKVQFFEGKEGVMAVYDDHIQIEQPYEMLGFADIEEISKFLPFSYFSNYCREKERKGITTRGIFADNPTAKKYEIDIYGKVNPKTKPVVRYVPAGQFPLKGEITMYGENKVSIIQLWGENSSAILIEDKPYYDMMKVIFELAWNQLNK